MSFNLRNIREISTDPTTKFVSHLAKKVSDFINASQTQDLENKEDIYSSGQDVDAVVKFHALSSNKQFKFNLPYLPPAEPDLTNCRLWIQGHNMGNNTRDLSGYDRISTLYGDPILVDGSPFDYGINTGDTKSIALRFNRPTSATVNEEHIQITHDTLIRATEGLSTGASWFIRFKIYSFASENGWAPTLFAKRDNSSTADGIRVTIESSSRIRVRLRNGGVSYDNDFDSLGLVAGTVYDLWLTYTVSGNVVKLYLNGVEKTATSISGNSSGFGTPTTDLDWYLFKKGGSEAQGHLYGDLYDFMILREKIVTFNTIGSSIQLNGTNQYIDCGNHADLWSQPLSKFSFSFWVYPTSGWDTFNRQMVEKSGGSAHGFRCEIDDNVTGQVKAHIRDSVNATKQSLNNNLILSQWNFITFVYDNSLGSANVKVYVNGIAPSSTADLTEVINQSAILTLSQSSNDLQGNIRDFRWWTNKALSQAEITELYNKSLSAPLPSYWLLLTEGSGTPQDVIGETKTATLVNSPTWINSEVGNHYTNKWTTAGIPFGQVMVSDYYSPYTHKYMLFDGNDDDLDCGNETSLWNQSLTTFAFSCWIFPTAGWDTNDRIVVWKTFDLANGFTCRIDSSVANRINFIVRIGSTNTTAFNTTLQLNQWNHIICSYNKDLGSANVRMYVNGVIGTSANQTGTITDAGFGLELGGGVGLGLKGYMKDFKWFTTDSKDTSEAMELYLGTESTVPDFWLPMLEGYGDPKDIISGTKIGDRRNGTDWAII